MDIPTIRVFTAERMPLLSPDRIRAGIEDRLALLTYLFCPDKEENPVAVIARLRVEAGPGNEVRIRWRPRMRFPIRVYRFGPELPDQLASVAADYDEQRQYLAAATDGAGLFQGYERNDMGWPTALAVAAVLAEARGGIIATSTSGWFRVQGRNLLPVPHAAGHTSHPAAGRLRR